MEIDDGHDWVLDACERGLSQCERCRRLVRYLGDSGWCYACEATPIGQATARGAS